MTDSTFLWGAATAPHQIEGNNLNSDFWAGESRSGMELSLDALDSYHRYAEEMKLLADAGLNAYRFGVEWARIEPRKGHFSRAELAHYRRMIDTAIQFGLEPVITLHHFTSPIWFAEQGGWLSDDAIERFSDYVSAVSTILDGVKWVVTINEPNMLAVKATIMCSMQSGETESWQSPTIDGDAQPVLPSPDPEIGERLIAAHHAARDILHATTQAAVGWSIASQALFAAPGGEAKLIEVRYQREDLYLEGARGDDFVGIQAYSTQAVDANGVVPHESYPDNTLVGTPYRPEAIGAAVRHAWVVTEGVPVVVTENGIATSDDARRIAYTSEALTHLFAAQSDGIDVRGYLHWSALDNYEWGHWGPTFGLISVDRETFVRTPKPSLAWLGGVAQRNTREQRDQPTEGHTL